jgi:hypothetical protein
MSPSTNRRVSPELARVPAYRPALGLRCSLDGSSTMVTGYRVAIATVRSEESESTTMISRSMSAVWRITDSRVAPICSSSFLAMTTMLRAGRGDGKEAVADIGFIVTVNVRNLPLLCSRVQDAHHLL